MKCLINKYYSKSWVLGDLIICILDKNLILDIILSKGVLK